MSIDVLNEAPFELAFRLVEDSGDSPWYVVLTAADQARATADEIDRCANRLEPGISVRGDIRSLTDFERELAAVPHRIWIGTGFETFDDQAWATADLDRSRLIRHGVSVMVLDDASFRLLRAHAPNLSSLIQGEVLRARTEQETNAGLQTKRLAELRDWAGMTDEEVIRRAEAGTLDRGPLFVEWLVLLGRGDLLGKS